MPAVGNQPSAETLWWATVTGDDMQTHSQLHTADVYGVTNPAAATYACTQTSSRTE